MTIVEGIIDSGEPIRLRKRRIKRTKIKLILAKEVIKFKKQKRKVKSIWDI